MERGSANLGRRVVLLAAASVALGAARAPAPKPASKPAASPAAAARDLTGVWTNASWTMLQRPKAATGLVISAAEGEKLHAAFLSGFAKFDTLGQATSEFPEFGDGYARIGGQLRSSWITDPPDGRLPYTEATRKAVDVHRDPDGPGYDNVEDRPTGERCLTSEGAGAPILNSPDTNLVTLVLSPGALAIVSEKNHDARIVRIGGPAPGPDEPRSWMGTSVGHWEGATLVVETSRLRPGLTWLSDASPLSDKARVTERFTRTSPDEITYAFAVDDPGAYAKPWGGEMVFRASPRPMFEFACHEGNYSLPGILAGGQKAQAEAQAAKGK